MDKAEKLFPEQILARHANEGTPYGSACYPKHISTLVETLAPERWLDVGCDEAQLIKATQGSWQHAVGVEMDKRAAAVASKVASEVHACAFDAAVPLLHDRYPDGFDLISFNDVLEHMPNPWQAMALAKTLLAPGGVLLMQVPNVAHYSVIRQLLSGRFDYESTGLLDATHLRFFTPNTFAEAAERAGLTVLQRHPVRIVTPADRTYLERLKPLAPDTDVLDCFQICLVCSREEDRAHPALPKLEQALRGSARCVRTADYQHWLSLVQIRAAEIETLAQRAAHWASQPVFTLFIHASTAELPLLADTLDSLGPQRYPLWRLVVLSDTASPDSMFDGQQLVWLQVPDLADTAALAEAETACLGAIPDGWHARLVAGCRLDPLWLLTLADYLNVEPKHAAFYCDHDRVSVDGTRSDPWFKPDFDVDYLYEMDYVGPTVAFANAAVLAAGGIEQAGAWGHIDTLLRLVEKHDTGIIGHISKPLLSLPDAYKIPVEADQRARSAINSAHFARRAITAQCKPGFIDGTLRIEHLRAAQPKVSVVIPNRDKVEYLEPCVESLIAQTDWPDFEVLIVDNQSEEPETLDYYRSLQARFGERVRVIAYDAPFNFSAQCNLGAREARGDYLLFLNNDTQIIQPQWLSRMMAHAQRDGVGAVGCRLAYPEDGKTQHAGVSFNFASGLNHSEGHAFENLERDDPGYMNRAWVTQQFSAVTAACLLTRTQVFQSTGGFDEQAFAVLFNDVDYCLRLRQSGLRVLYTPYATVCHHENTSLNSISVATLQRRLYNLERTEQERANLLDRWLHHMANDPAMNRHLTAQADGTLALEQSIPLGWDTTFHDCPRIYGFGNNGGVGRYRLAQPLAMLEAQGQAAALMTTSTQLPTITQLARLAPDTLLVHNAYSDGEMEALAAYRQYMPQVRLVTGLDDLVTAIPKENSCYGYWRRNMRDIKSRLRKSLAQCDRLIVSTEPLRELCSPLISDIHVVPNRLRRCEWDGHTSLRGQGSKPRVGWVGALQHAGDLALIREVVRALQHEVEWVFMGMWPEGLEDVEMERHAPVPYEDYPATMAALNLDIALAPLDDNDFNRCKSNLRLLEYGAMAWPVIASDVYPFRTNDAPVTRVGTDPQEWIAAIRSLTQDPARAAREGQVLRAWVDRHYWLDDHFQDWQQALLG